MLPFFDIFFIIFVLLFALSGFSAGSTYQMLAVIFREISTEAAKKAGMDDKAAAHKAIVDTAAASGFISVLGAVGGYLIPQSFGWSLAWTGNSMNAMYLFIAMYVLSILLLIKEEIRAFAEQWLGKRLVTRQTDAHGQPVNKLLIEPFTAMARELYLGAVVDRVSQRVVFLSSTEGGVEIETIAAQTPEKILKETIDPLTGAQPWQGRELAFQLGLSGEQVQQFTGIFLQLAKLFEACDLSLVEINPLVVTSSGDLLCLDAKINIDNNALYRQPQLKAMDDPTQEDPREARAAAWELNYVALEGNIGCMVNGAGLAMATMDLVKLYGGAPANFLDVGGSATQERVTEAFNIILTDGNVKAILVNIFGGIVRCDLIAGGILDAVGQAGVKEPVVVRLEGNQAETGTRLLADSGLRIKATSNLTEAVQHVVMAAEQQS